MQNNEWPYKYFADYTGHFNSGTKILHLLLGSTRNIVEQSNLRFIFVQYSHDFTWI